MRGQVFNNAREKGDDMGKKIVSYTDGTWNEPVNETNVWKLYQGTINDDPTQVAHYDDGVGTDGTPIDHLLGGAFGQGINGKIKVAYSWIASQYEPDDLIYLFGFSRGAFTARCVAGMIAIVGLPTRNLEDPKMLDMAFEAYRNSADRAAILEAMNSSYGMYDAKIQMVGVWDTVGSLGIPAIFGGIDVTQYGFLDANLHPDVLNAVQALAIDEKRLQFQATLWNPTNNPLQTLTQVWFAGCHCDVGGGNQPEDGLLLSTLPLHWMAHHASSHGMLVDWRKMPPIDLHAEALAKINESLTGLYTLTPHLRNIAVNACLYESVQFRCATPTADYAPGNLHVRGGQLANAYTIVTAP